MIATFLRTIFFLRKKRRARKNLSECACFERKIENFSFKTHTLQRNPSLHAFRAKREIVRNPSYISRNNFVQSLTPLSIKGRINELEDRKLFIWRWLWFFILWRLKKVSDFQNEFAQFLKLLFGADVFELLCLFKTVNFHKVFVLSDATC